MSRLWNGVYVVTANACNDGFGVLPEPTFEKEWKCTLCRNRISARSADTNANSAHTMGTERPRSTTGRCARDAGESLCYP